MLYRKIDKYIVSHLQSGSDKILIVDGARQIGKSYIIREIGKKLFPNYIEVNMETDKLGDRTFADARTVDDFYLALSALAGDRMKEKDNTLVFIDEFRPTTTCLLCSSSCAKIISLLILPAARCWVLRSRLPLLFLWAVSSSATCIRWTLRSS